MAIITRFCIRIIAVTLGLFLLCQTSWAAKAYITDFFRISLRRGPSIENKILRFVPSGLPVEIYESQDGWSRVRLLEGEQGILEGWVLSRYLIKRMPWEDQTRSLRGENARLKEKLARIDQEWEEKVSREHGQGKQLKTKYEIARKNAQRLAEENEVLKSSKRKKWFATGALVLLSGWVVGLMAGKNPRKRNLSY